MGNKLNGLSLNSVTILINALEDYPVESYWEGQESIESKQYLLSQLYKIKQTIITDLEGKRRD